MTETDKDALLGRIVRKHAEASRNLLLLREDAQARAEALRRLCEALEHKELWRLTDRCKTVLDSLQQEGLDWGKLTEQSLRTLLDDLQSAEKLEADTRQEKLSAI